MLGGVLKRKGIYGRKNKDVKTISSENVGQGQQIEFKKVLKLKGSIALRILQIRRNKYSDEISYCDSML